MTWPGYRGNHRPRTRRMEYAMNENSTWDAAQFVKDSMQAFDAESITITPVVGEELEKFCQMVNREA